jgi:hypothetical protein
MLAFTAIALRPEPKCSEAFARANALALTTTVLAITLSGCGIGTLATPSTSPIVAPAISGRIFGGPNSIIGATVKVYTTGKADGTNGGYGVATERQEANSVSNPDPYPSGDTSLGGGFQFAGGYSCPSGQFAYIVAAGGETGAVAAVNTVLVAPLGRCDDLYTGDAYTGPGVDINEVTTIVAAYALGQFSSVSGSGAATVVQIGADATNNAAEISSVSTGCVGGVGSCTTTAVAGLAHAFLNVANLVNTNTGTVNATLPGDSSAIVPRELIDAIGNSLDACVNSSGGTAGDSSACGAIFKYTSIGSNVPSNTFSAMVNLAANPTLGGSISNVSGFFNIANPFASVYYPTLSSAPINDYSIGISYPTGLGASTSSASLSTCKTNPCQGILFPESGALDINDVYYVANSAICRSLQPASALGIYQALRDNRCDRLRRSSRAVL